ncbi:MAG: glycosyltransferase family 9 protein [Candidatus Limimorpha sp.]
MKKKFLVIQTASIGDVILATAVMEKLHLYYSDSQIDILIKKGYEGLFANHSFVGKVLTWDKKGGKYRNLFLLIKEVRAERYDLIVDIQRHFATGMLTVLGGARETAGFDKNPLSMFFTHRVRHVLGVRGVHEVDRNNKLIEHITDDKPAKPRLYPDSSDFAKVMEYKSKRYICVAPCSLWATKQFPVERWVGLLSNTPDGLRVYLLGGGADKDVCREIVSGLGGKDVVSLAGQLSLLESAALMRDAAMNFVNDSSPMHLASSQNAPVTAVFCSTVPDFGFGPLSDDSLVVEERQGMECRPCGLHGYRKCPKGHFNCAYNIDINELINRL